MRVTSSYGVEIKKQSIPIRHTPYATDLPLCSQLSDSGVCGKLGRTFPD